MLHDENKKPLLLLFIGEILAGLTSLSFLGSIVNAFGFISFLGIVGFVISLIGIIRLKNSCREFRDVFYGVTLALVLYLVASILACIPAGGTGADVLLFIVSLLVLLAKVVQFYNIIRTVEGCTVLTKSEDNARLGKIAVRMFLVGLAIMVICIILAGIFQFALKEGSATGIGLEICSIFAAVLGVASEVVYIIFLYKSYAALE